MQDFYPLFKQKAKEYAKYSDENGDAVKVLVVALDGKLTSIKSLWALDRGVNMMPVLTSSKQPFGWKRMSPVSAATMETMESKNALVPGYSKDHHGMRTPTAKS